MILSALLFAAQLSNPAEPSDAQCGQCHAREARALSASPMALAMQTPASSNVLRNITDLSFREGKFSWAVRHEDGKPVYSVSDGANTLSAPIAWAFGKGVVGQTWLVERNGALYEGTVSYYSAPGNLDLTPGHSVLRRDTLEEAFGRKIDAPEARRCFGCHSTDAVWKSAAHPDSVIPGVQCWQCHAGSRNHADALKAGRGGPATRPARLRTVTNEALAAVCNQCHPGWAEVATKGPSGVLNVRMQFYRLTNSRCYDSADRRISCVACHDPHGDLSTDTAAYDSRCQTCHAQKKCPVATSDCVSCHMPKVEIPGLHYQFTDHQIRVARKGEPYPN